MTTIIPLRVTGLDMSDDATACRLYEQWGAELATKNDVTMLLLTIDDTDDIISTVADSISQITLAFPEVVALQQQRKQVSRVVAWQPNERLSKSQPLCIG